MTSLSIFGSPWPSNNTLPSLLAWDPQLFGGITLVGPAPGTVTNPRVRSSRYDVLNIRPRFNIGVEIGQVAIILAIWPALYLLDKLRPNWANLGRSAVALPCIAIAALWAGQRLGLLIQ